MQTVRPAMSKRPLAAVSVFILAGDCGSPRTTPPAPLDGSAAPPDSSGAEENDGVAGSASRASPCAVGPYPNGMACSDTSLACVPEGGFDCCLCEMTRNCTLP